jgi:hypothetical protein
VGIVASDVAEASAVKDSVGHVLQVVTDIGRADLLLGLTAASDCPSGPHISGILCTNAGHQDISPHVQHILNVRLGIHDSPTNHGWLMTNKIISVWNLASQWSGNFCKRLW